MKQRYTIEYVDGNGKPATTECVVSRVEVSEGVFRFAENDEVLIIPVARVIMVSGILEEG